MSDEKKSVEPKKENDEPTSKAEEKDENNSVEPEKKNDEPTSKVDNSKKKNDKPTSKVENPEKKNDESTSKVDNSKKESKNPNKNKKVLLFISILIISLLVGFVLTNYIKITHKQEEQKTFPKEVKTIENNDIEKFEKFKEQWEERVSYIELNHNLNLENYYIKDDVLSSLESFIKIDNSKYTNNIEKMKNSENSPYFNLPLINGWFKKRSNIKYTQSNKKPTTNNELYKKIENTLHQPYSLNSIDKIIELNDFCYYFEQHKEDFYEEGYPKSIKTCKDIDTKLSKSNINIKFSK